IDLFLKDGKIPLKIEATPNEYLYLEAPENSNTLGKFDKKANALISLLKVTDVWGVSPRNPQQRCAIDLLLRDDIKLVTLIGPAGTGKTLLALACALKKVFDDAHYKRILVSRPVVPLGRDIGYLPGTKEEKLYHWMQAIYDNLEFLTSRDNSDSRDTLNWVLDSEKLEMEAVTYIRGRSLPNVYMIIDEAQNLTPHEIKTIVSRAGDDTKVVLTGDPTQIDNPYLDKDSNGLTYTIGRFSGQPIFGSMFLETTERSHLAALAADIL
ncbi:MAG: PhoH family protein, partial [Chlamydiia bacterium]|nr:PhoH family protein [Chlamydiia bacterium]